MGDSAGATSAGGAAADANSVEVACRGRRGSYGGGRPMASRRPTGAGGRYSIVRERNRCARHDSHGFVTIRRCSSHAGEPWDSHIRQCSSGIGHHYPTPAEAAESRNHAQPGCRSSGPQRRDTLRSAAHLVEHRYGGSHRGFRHRSASGGGCRSSSSRCRFGHIAGQRENRGSRWSQPALRSRARPASRACYGAARPHPGR